MGGTSGPLRNLVPPPACQKWHFIHHSTGFLRKKKKKKEKESPNTTNKQNLIVLYDDVFKGKPLLWLVVCFTMFVIMGQLGVKRREPQGCCRRVGTLTLQMWQGCGCLALYLVSICGLAILKGSDPHSPFTVPMLWGSVSLFLFTSRN